MRRALVLPALAASLFALTVPNPAAACGGPAPETMALISAVSGGIPWSDMPKRPHMSALVILTVDQELKKTPRLKEVYAKLAANRDNRDWFPALEELESARALACITTALWHPHIDVKIRSAQALGRLGGIRAGHQLLETARSSAILQSGSEDATLHGIFQHALAEALNRILKTAVKLKPGQDPEGIRSGIATWSEGLAKLRQTPPPGPSATPNGSS